MPVITFARFVVVAQHTFTGNNESEAVLVKVLRARKRRRYLPHDNLCERVVGVGNALSDKWGSLHEASVPVLAFVVN